MARYFCRNCGKDYSSIRDLTSFKCPRSPLGAGKGPHELYEGSEKDRYTCIVLSQPVRLYHVFPDSVAQGLSV